MVYVVGAVLSHHPQFSSMSQVWGAVVFHVACMVSGVYCLQKAAAARQAARETALVS